MKEECSKSSDSKQESKLCVSNVKYIVELLCGFFSEICKGEFKYF